MPGLLRGIARTAVIAGTATSVSNRVSRRQGERWAREQYYPQAQTEGVYPAFGTPAYAQPTYAPIPGPSSGATAAPAPAPGSSTDDRLRQLKQLGELHAQGALTDAEFAAEKARVLAS
ncbi:SHOCT domain-containing protein [Gordonia sp. CPCC 205515]|uniref:SHOCT domain-containing protein n=1 Tax=Gordonia sp. CPCC 205515 TaxID=3140791 RepID=UPI003AF3AD23